MSTASNLAGVSSITKAQPARPDSVPRAHQEAHKQQEQGHLKARGATVHAG